MKIWITDGSGVPFNDIAALTAHHRGMLGRDVPYKGALDEDVPVRNARVFMQDPADCLVPEAEWCIWFPGGTDLFAADTKTLTESTPIVMQGMIEGKWLNRVGDELAFKPASLGNNLLAQGPGIAGTLASLEDGGMQGEIRVQHTGRAGLRAYTSAIDELRGHDVLGLARAVIAHCREQSLAVEAVDCSAVGPDSDLVQDRRFLQQVMAAAGVTPEELSNPSAWKRLAPEITKIAIGEGLVVEPGQPIALVVTAGPDTVGRGEMTVYPTRDTAL